MRDKDIEIKANMKMGEFADMINAINKLDLKYWEDEDMKFVYEKFIDNFKWKEI